MNQHIVYAEVSKFKGRKKDPQGCIISFYSKDTHMFNELVIKNIADKNETIFVIIEGLYLPFRQISL